MSFAAKFSEKPLDEPGYDEIAKGVYQLWRFFSHCRRGLVNRDLSENAVGVVLTLDSWLTMAHTLYDEIFRRARVMAAQKNIFIIDEDERPIVFCAISDLERSLVWASKSSFVAAIREASKPDNHGWIFNSVHEKFVDEDAQLQPYPMLNRMGEVLPWWEMMGNYKIGKPSPISV